jgi:hypothetical protein
MAGVVADQERPSTAGLKFLTSWVATQATLSSPRIPAAAGRQASAGRSAGWCCGALGLLEPVDEHVDASGESLVVWDSRTRPERPISAFKVVQEVASVNAGDPEASSTGRNDGF